MLPAILTAAELPRFAPSAEESCDPEIEKLFPHTAKRRSVWRAAAEGSPLLRRPLSVGVLFSGGPAPGGHNVISGLFDGLKRVDPASKLYGFLGGPSGLLEDKLEQLSADRIAPYRNQGGFDLLGSGRTKIESQEQLATAAKRLLARKLDALVIVGGDDSNTNAALLAEYLEQAGHPISVIGVPKTIDGDLTTPQIPVSFGFDTACRTYSEMIGNLQRDALSMKKYTHIVKLMGRSASHIALECALHCQSDAVLLGEELRAARRSLADVVRSLADLVIDRSERGEPYGVILVPEGLIEFLPEMEALLKELERAEGSKLTPAAEQLFCSLPERMRHQLLQDRDPHGNINLSHIETDRLLIEMVERELQARQFTGKFAPVSHFFGYEGRSAYPSHFDTHYTYALGCTASYLAAARISSCMVAIFNPQEEPSSWQVGAVPLTPLLTLEERKGKRKPVIRKTLVDLQGPLMAKLTHLRASGMGSYLYPGPIQFGGAASWQEQLPWALRLRQERGV